MNNSKIIEITLKVFKECAVQSFPIDCLRLLRYYGYKIYTYQELSRKNRELHEMCMSFSEDAFQDGHSMIIAYNQDRPKGRIRFSLMHELGHCLLGHAGISQSNEQEANAFASNILAPRMAVYYSRCKNASDVSHVFDISYGAAALALKDSQLWYLRASRQMTSLDRTMYQHFYQKSCGRFVWNIKQCPRCSKTLYNNQECTCRRVDTHSSYFTANTKDLFSKEDVCAFTSGMNRWLYGESQ